MVRSIWGQNKKTNHTLLMLLTVAITGLAGCSSPANHPPKATQQADLIDTDGDGVINERDMCSNTIAGAKVNNDGCAELIIISAEDELNILFENNSDKIQSDYQDEVDQMSSFMKDFPETIASLKGYSSTPGARKYNKILSIKRASAVKDALVKSGIKPERITIQGFGEQNIVQAATKSQSDMLSRRVTASVSAFEESVLMQWTIYTSAQK